MPSYNGIEALPSYLSLLVVEGTFLLYFAVVIQKFLTSINDCRMMKQIYGYMRVEEESLCTIQWGQIVDRLVQLQVMDVCVALPLLPCTSGLNVATALLMRTDVLTYVQTCVTMKLQLAKLVAECADVSRALYVHEKFACLDASELLLRLGIRHTHRTQCVTQVVRGFWPFRSLMGVLQRWDWGRGMEEGRIGVRALYGCLDNTTGPIRAQRHLILMVYLPSAFHGK